MAIHRMFRIDIVGNNNFLIKDNLAEEELFATKLYLIKVSTANVEVYFNFIVHHTEDAIVEIYQNPTITSNGTLLTGGISPTVLSIYSGPTVTNNGTEFYSIGQDDVRGISVHDLILTANTDYLLKIIPYDLAYNVLS